jgi:site-specific DNA-methyltransferase (adenine-specific)
MKSKKVIIGSVTLYHGNCFDVLPKLDVEFDAVISDPPFGITDCDWDKSIPLDRFWELVERKTKPTANIVLFGCGRFSHALYSSNPDWFRYDMIWAKTKKCGHLNANLQPMRNHESIYVFIRPGCVKKATYNPQKTLGGKVGVKTVSHKSSIYRDCGKFTHVSDGTQHPSSILYFKSETGYHSTQKPVLLLEHLVQSYTNKTEIVIDPFMGSGTTGVACVRTDRQFIGIEQDPQYFEIACERIKKAYTG